tara:strand:- start:114 stop:542 length:429 start_codon:yes stop_codon:yes gene_type:complete
MNYKRAVGIGIVAYIASFIIGIAIGVLLNVDFSSTGAVSNSMWYTGIIAQVVVALFFAYWYFSGKSVKEYGIQEGISLAAIFVVVGFAIDLLFMLPLMATDGMAREIWALYSHPLFLVSILVLFLGTSFVGSYFDDQNPSDE